MNGYGDAAGFEHSYLAFSITFVQNAPQHIFGARASPWEVFLNSIMNKNPTRLRRSCPGEASS
jgi:hypothetical protein